MRQFHICCGLSSTELTIPRLTCNHWFAGMSLALHFLWGGPQPAWPFWVGPSSAVPVPTKTEGGSSTTGNRRLPQPGSTCKTKQQQQQKSSTKQANKQKKINSKQTQRPEGICDRAPSPLTMIISLFPPSDVSLYTYPQTHGMFHTHHPHLTQGCTSSVPVAVRADRSTGANACTLCAIL